MKPINIVFTYDEIDLSTVQAALTFCDEKCRVKPFYKPVTPGILVQFKTPIEILGFGMLLGYIEANKDNKSALDFAGDKFKMLM